MSVDALTAEIHDVVEGLYGRPRRTRGVTIVISNLLCSSGDPCWVAKVKFGALVVAKCGAPPCGHFSPEAALEGVLEQARRALGVS
jgi:hypothetical protein